MKNLLVLTLFVLISTFANAQDVIIKKNGEDLKVKVIEIGLDEIKYKRIDHSGLLYFIVLGFHTRVEGVYIYVECRITTTVSATIIEVHNN